MCGSRAKKEERRQRKLEKLEKLSSMLSQSSLASSRAASVHAPAMRNIPIVGHSAAPSLIASVRQPQQQQHLPPPPPYTASSPSSSYTFDPEDISRMHSKKSKARAEEELLARATDNTQGGYYAGAQPSSSLAPHLRALDAKMPCVGPRSRRSGPPSTVMFTPRSSRPASVADVKELDGYNDDDDDDESYAAPPGPPPRHALATDRHVPPYSASQVGRSPTPSIYAPVGGAPIHAEDAEFEAYGRAASRASAVGSRFAVEPLGDGKYERKERKHLERALKCHRRRCAADACWCRAPGTGVGAGVGACAGAGSGSRHRNHVGANLLSFGLGALLL